AVGPAHDDEGPDRDHGSVHGRVDVAADRRADIERRRSATGQLVPLRRAASATEDAVHYPLHEALVRLVSDRLEGECAVAGGVVADSGQAALRDRKLEVDLPSLRDDLGGRS